MSTIELDSPMGDVIQTNEADTSVQPTQTNEVIQTNDAEKLLQAEYTRTRQALIDSTKRLVEKDGSELHSIQDPKLRDSVSKMMFNMGYAEATAVFGKDFTSTSVNKGDEPSADSDIQRELRLLKYRNEQQDIDIAINNLKTKSPEMFNWVGDMEEKIREELWNIVSTLPIEERIRRAATNVVGSIYDSTSLAYKLLNQKNSWALLGGSKQVNEDKKATKNDEIVSNLSSIMLKSMGLNKNK